MGGASVGEPSSTSGSSSTSELSSSRYQTGSETRGDKGDSEDSEEWRLADDDSLTEEERMLVAGATLELSLGERGGASVDGTSAGSTTSSSSNGGGGGRSGSVDGFAKPKAPLSKQ